MQFVTRLKTKEEIDKLNQLGIDIFCLDTDFTARKVEHFRTSEIIDLAKQYPDRIYILVNKIIHEQDLKPLHTFFSKLQSSKIAGIVINDFSVYLVAKKYQMDNLIIYQPGTFNTDTYSKTYLASRNLKGLTISREITLDEIKNFEANDIELSIIGHGYLDMFYSKRELLTNYFIHKEIKNKKSKNNYDFKLNEEIRPNEFYPILEDEFGTHIFRSKKLISYDQIETLNPLIKDFFIERIFLSDKELEASIQLYKNQISLNDFLNQFKDYDSGFYNQRTEKVKGELDENWVISSSW